jgi:hypothetical protein
LPLLQSRAETLKSVTDGIFRNFSQNFATLKSTLARTASFRKSISGGLMFRIAGSIVAATIVSLTLSLAVTGCSSDSNNNNPDSGSSNCDLTGAEAVFTAKCTASGCHNATDKTSGLDLAAGSDLPTRLLGVMPMSISFFCASSAMPYLTAHTTPATGLLLDKITKSMPTCGARMPFNLPPLSSTEIACIQSWANTVTSP